MKENHSIVKHTNDYMLRAITEKNGHEYHNFELKKSKKWNDHLHFSGNKTAESYRTAELLINSQRVEFDKVLNQLIKERIGPTNSCFTNMCGETHFVTSKAFGSDKTTSGSCSVNDIATAAKKATAAIKKTAKKPAVAAKAAVAATLSKT